MIYGTTHPAQLRCLVGQEEIIFWAAISRFRKRSGDALDLHKNCVKVQGLSSSLMSVPHVSSSLDGCAGCATQIQLLYALHLVLHLHTAVITVLLTAQ